MKGRSTGGMLEKSRNRRDHSIALDISLGHSQGNGMSADTCGDEAKEVDPKELAAVWELSCEFVVGNKVDCEEETTFFDIAVQMVGKNMQ